MSHRVGRTVLTSAVVSPNIATGSAYNVNDAVGSAFQIPLAVGDASGQVAQLNAFGRGTANAPLRGTGTGKSPAFFSPCPSAALGRRGRGMRAKKHLNEFANRINIEYTLHRAAIGSNRHPALGFNAGHAQGGTDMAATLEEKDWQLLLGRIRDGKCTPFLGAGACYGVLPLGADIARDWAQQHHYPLDDHTNLTRVSQYLAVEYDPVFPKDEIIKRFRTVQPPDFTNPNEPHRVLADLPLPLYMTTNYDDFMFQALRRGGVRTPRQVLCAWNTFVDRAQNGSDQPPDPANPVVFHLHGYAHMPESLVLTEDDYLDFIVNFARDEDILPHYIRRAFTANSLLFIGYSIADMNFRVLFRSIIGYLEKSIGKAHVSVQLVPVAGGATDDQKQRAQQYLDRYFGELKIRVYWGTALDFARELRQRWEAFPK